MALDGRGDPNTSPAYTAAVQALYAVSYAAKFLMKKEGGQDFKVSPLEGLWWAEDLSTFTTGDKSDWEWKRQWYLDNGYVEGETLFTTVDDELGGLDRAAIAPIRHAAVISAPVLAACRACSAARSSDSFDSLRMVSRSIRM